MSGRPPSAKGSRPTSAKKVRIDSASDKNLDNVPRINAYDFNGDVISYEDVLVTQYLDELKRAPPYTKHGTTIPLSPYLQPLVNRYMASLEKAPGNKRPMSASASFQRPGSGRLGSGRPRSGKRPSSGKPKIDPKFIADPDLWDPISPREKSTKKQRPASAPVIRRPLSATYASGIYIRRAKQRAAKSLYKQKQSTIVATAYKNGSRDTFIRLAAPNIKILLEICTDKLGLPNAARKIFLEGGKEVKDESEIERDTEIYISMGENYKDPYVEPRQQNQLKSKATWTMNGVVFPPDQKRGKTKPKLSKRFQQLIGCNKRRILVYKNGKGTEGMEIVADPDKIEEFLTACTAKLDLRSYAKILYDWEGGEIKSLLDAPVLDQCLQASSTPVLGPLWVSCGEGFSPTGVSHFLRGLIHFTQSKLIEAQHYKKQLEYAQSDDDMVRSHIEIVPILSMKEKEIADAIEQVDKDVEDFETALQHLKDQRNKISDQVIQEESCNDYTVQHIQRLEVKDRLVGTRGIRLRVYENGSYDDPNIVYFNLSQAERGIGLEDKGKIKERLLDACTNRNKLANPKNPNLWSVAKKLYDNLGKEILDVTRLTQDKEVWLSFGEPFKNPFTYALSAVFDKATVCDVADKRVAVREQLMPEDMQPWMDSPDAWESYLGFPEDGMGESYDPIHSQIQESHVMTLKDSSEIDLSSSFIRSKVDQKLFLFPEVVMDTKKPKGAKGLWPAEVQSWVFSKGGYIYNKGLPSVVLGVSEYKIKGKINLPSSGESKSSVEGFAVCLQKKMPGSLSQQWRFTTDGYMYTPAQPELVLTYLGAVFGSEDSQIANEVEGIPVGVKFYVAVCEKLNGKEAKTQRWAIKQERMDNLGQWKHNDNAVVDNPEWNKRAYSWPVSSDGELNENFDWPMEGYLLPYAPPMKVTKKKSSGMLPKRLLVMKNGERDFTQAMPIVGPDLTNMMKDMKKDNVNQKGRGHHSGSKGRVHQHVDNTDTIEDDDYLHCHHDMTLVQLELQLFLERCTTMLNLPFAARRLFDETGREHRNLIELSRDQIVYVSCGETWTDPSVSKAEQQRRFLLANLAADVAKIRQFVALRSAENMVLEVEDLNPGARLSINECCIAQEEREKREEEEMAQMENEDESDKNMNSILGDNLTAHERAHLNAEERHNKMKWPWERIYNGGFDELGETNGEEDFFTNKELYKKYRVKQRQNTKPANLHHQKFVFEDGFIALASRPDLVLAISSDEGVTAEVALERRRPDDIYSRWVMQDNGIIHAKANSHMVLSVMMPSYPKQEDEYVPITYTSATVQLSPVKNTQFGRANQRWHHDKETGFLYAFHTDENDKQITAANKANVCTYAVMGDAELDQPGYIVEMATEDKKSDKKSKVKKIVVCSSCARAMRGRYKVQKVTGNMDFSCAMGNAKEKGIKQIGSFQCLNGKVDLSSYEAEQTLSRWEDQLARLREEMSVRTIAKEISAANAPFTVKVIAYKNGEGRMYPGQIIVGSSVGGILNQSSHRLQMASAARRLYTADGMIILDLDDLIDWVKDKYVEEEKKRILEERQPPRKTSQIQESESAQGSEQPSQPSSGPVEVQKLMAKVKLKDDDPNNQAPANEGEAEQTEQETQPPLKAEDIYVERPSTDSVLRVPIEVWASSGEPFVNPDDVEKKHSKSLAQREERAPVARELEKEKHVLRQLQGRRYEKLNPGDYVSNRSSRNPVLIEDHWQDPTPEELMKHDTVHQLQIHLAELKALQKQRIKPCNVNTTKRLYVQPSMKRILIFPNGERIDRAVYVWGESMAQILDNSTTRLNLRKPARVLFSIEGEEIENFESLEKDQLVCASHSKPFLKPKDANQYVEIKANWGRARRQYGPAATDVLVDSQRNPHIDVDPFGPPALAYGGQR